MDGSTATRLMRERGLKLPIYALTANAMKGFEEEIATAGFTGYLTKPLDIDQLVATLAETLGGEQATEAPVQDPPAVRGPAAAPAISATEPPLVSRLADKPRLLPAIQKFTARLGEQLDAMEQAWQTRNFTELAALAHWLKGAAGTVGYDAFTEPSIALEQLVKAGAESEIGAALEQLRRLQHRIVVPEAVLSPPQSSAS
jgi:CheY-like chemotaxis protein